MVGDFTCTSAMSGEATNTVAAAPGSLIAVPFWTSSVSVGCCGGTIWLWPNARPGAPPVVTVGAAGEVVDGDGGWTGVGVGGRAWASRGSGPAPAESGVATGITATGCGAGGAGAASGGA